jgi:uroporphyrinogen decarboxylase
MESRERCLAALNHLEADRIPFDVGGTVNTTIHVKAYAALRDYLGLPRRKIETLHQAAQVARLDEDFLEKLGVDTRFVDRDTPITRNGAALRDEGEYVAFSDSWGVGWRMPKQGGLYYDMYLHPLDVEDLDEQLKTYEWPDANNPVLFAGQLENAIQARQQNKLVLLGGFSAGLVEKHAWLRGYLRAYTDYASNPRLLASIMDILTELKITYWENALARVKDYIDVVVEGDDFAGQERLLISPQTFRQVIKPRHRAVFAAIKKAAPHVKIHFHSCGAIRPVIPDLIEIGVDALNPVQISAAGMDPYGLKKDFGKDLVFWGGGVDTQKVFGSGSVQDVRDNVRRNIDALAPGGGFIFTPVHNTQANVPPENFMMMWETLQEFGVYS